MFLLAAGYTMLRQGHVKIDVISGRFSQAHADLDRHHRPRLFRAAAGLCRDPPVAAARGSRLCDERVSSNAGGLIRWPVFAYAAARLRAARHPGVSELIKRVAFLRGCIPDPTQKPQGKSDGEQLAEFMPLKSQPQRANKRPWRKTP